MGNDIFIVLQAFNKNKGELCHVSLYVCLDDMQISNDPICDVQNAPWEMTSQCESLSDYVQNCASASEYTLFYKE